MIITFICGCTSKEIVARENIETMDRIDFDEEGFVICLDHHARRYGWRLSAFPNNQVRSAGAERWTSLEYEAFMLFGEKPPIPSLNFPNSTMEDRRDNRDPQKVGSEILDSVRVSSGPGGLEHAGRIS